MDPYAIPTQAANVFGQPQPDPFSSGGSGVGVNGGQVGGSPFGGGSPVQQQQQQHAYQNQQGTFQQPQPAYQQSSPFQQQQQQQQPQGGVAQPNWQQHQPSPDRQSFHYGASPQQGYEPFSQPPQPPQQALVPSQQPTNPYAIVQHPQQNNQWAAGAQPPTAPASYDPFAAPPTAPLPPSQQQQPSQAMVPVTTGPSSPYPGAPPYQQQQQPPSQPSRHEEEHSPPPPSRSPVNERSMVPASSSSYPGSPPREEPRDPETETPKGVAARNPYSSVLASEAPLGASPLPKADMVRKTGYVLSRISFRTIVMKKWKQSFWVQYGPHTMLWFRSQSDFDDWLNNPYHTQAQRNFLIKLAVNFAHDLYKPNVRGYQVTQCRTKSYGSKLIRQFKLERWMDYGPTIAAAFGSNNPKEVDDLREALVGCMRNTPLNGGIRATGAVRERGDQLGNDSPHAERGERRTDGGHHDASSFGGHNNTRQVASRSVASANDALNDQAGFDDANSLGAYPASAAPAPPVDLMDFSEPVVTQPPPQQFSGSPQGQSYPPQMQQSPPHMQQNPYQGQQQYAPPQQQYQGGVPMQQQPFLSSPTVGQPYGANPHMQQPYPPGQAQPQTYSGY